MPTWTPKPGCIGVFSQTSLQLPTHLDGESREAPSTEHTAPEKATEAPREVPFSYALPGVGSVRRS